MSRLISGAWCYKGIIVTLLWWCISLSASVRLYVTPDLGSMMLQRDYSNTAVVVHQSVCMSRLILEAWCCKGIIVTLLWWCISLSASVRLYVTPDLGSMMLQRDYSNTAVVVHQSVCMSRLILEAWCYKGIIVTLLWWCISLSASVRLYVTPDLGSMMLQRDYSNTAVVVHQSVCMSRLILEAWCYKGIIVTLLWWCISPSVCHAWSWKDDATKG